MNLARAIRIQTELASKVILEWDGSGISLVAGADFGYDPKERKIGAVIVVMKFPELEIIEVTRAIRKVNMPYIPGFLGFREGPVFFEAFRKIKQRPDVTLLDGNGIAHPRRMGLASYAGVILEVPTIGCAKKPFFPFLPPADRRGAFTHFKNRNKEKVGFCLRTRPGVKPVFVSPGHRVNFYLARKVVLDCARFRIPEPLREAHRLSQKLFRP
jgi:deoxyribonuclease V